MIHHIDFIDHSIVVAAISPTGIRLGWLDISVIAFPVLLAFAVTLYMRRFTRSVADYLAAGRCRPLSYLHTQMDMVLTATAAVSSIEVFSRTGFSLNLWTGYFSFCCVLLSMSGVITVRFRETRSFTFHQFFEVRYGKGVRVAATVVNCLSSLFTMGIAPMVAARFFVTTWECPSPCRWADSPCRPTASSWWC